MNYSMIRYILASVLSFEGLFLMLPVAVSVIYGEKQGLIYLVVAVASILTGFLFRLKKPKNKVIYAREGFVAVALSWILLSLVGALPFLLTGEIPNYIDALFETISGFTTTGSSILQGSQIEGLAMCTAFWRCFTHWVGGMGVLVFIMAVLPLSGSSNVHLMRAESPGPTVGKLVPKVKSTALILYGIYIGITCAEILCLFVSGLSLFESMTVTFSTVGTGGFGLFGDSIASYTMAQQIIITIFMLICATNFGIYYLILIKKPKEALLNEEVRWFFIIVLVSSLAITWNIHDQFENVFKAFQQSIFQVASIISTTGFTTANFDAWGELSRFILVLLMFVGACANSTGGGFKVSRLLIVIRAIKNEVMTVLHPRSVRKVHMDGRRVSDQVVRKVLCYLAVYVMIIIGSTMIVSLDGKDTTTNFTAVMATFNNIGPGLNDAFSSFSDFSILSKIVFMFDMLVGRLEIFSVLVLFTRGLWKISSRKAPQRSVE